jgi:cyclopropane fatty-acyl-phospholipid synthase-like methyltransferase
MSVFFDQVVKHLSRRYWRQVSEYAYRQTFPLRASNQEKFTRKYFIPRLTQDMHLVDFGCADGWHTLTVAPFVKKITGYDLNSALIQTATSFAEKNGIDNCEFRVADVTQLNIEQVDAGICAGLFTCLSLADTRKILIQLFNAMPAGSPLLLKDTLTVAKGKRREVRFFSRSRGAFYRTSEYWEKLVIEGGFQIRESEVIEKTNSKYLSKMMVAVRA